MHTPTQHLALLIPALIVVTLGYLTWVRIVPFKTCRHCHGLGRIQRRIGRPKPCKHCGGHGIRPRAFRGAQRTARRLRAEARGEDTHRAPAGSRWP